MKQIGILFEFTFILSITSNIFQQNISVFFIFSTQSFVDLQIIQPIQSLVFGLQLVILLAIIISKKVGLDDANRKCDQIQSGRSLNWTVLSQIGHQFDIFEQSVTKVNGRLIQNERFRPYKIDCPKIRLFSLKRFPRPFIFMCGFRVGQFLLKLSFFEQYTRNL